MEFKMKKATKVLVAGACAAALMVGSAVPAMAAPVPDDVLNDTKVSYDTSTIIPGTANWGVQIPKAITFTETMNDKIKADVELVNRDGGLVTEIPDNTLPANGVQVFISSSKGMKMSIDGAAEDASDPIPYEIVFSGATPGGTSLTINGANATAGTEVQMATLTKAASAATGLAERKAIANSNGSHKDILTFSFDNGLI